MTGLLIHTDFPFSSFLPQFSFDAVKGMLDDGVPSGSKWLCHPKAMQTYLSLLGSSQNGATLEACCGALQNLTANKGVVSTKKIIIRLTICVWCQWAFRITSDRLKKGEKQLRRRSGGNNDTTAQLTRRIDWFREKGWSFDSVDSEGFRERKKKLEDQLDLFVYHNANMDCSSEVGDTANVFFCIAFASLPGVQHHESDSGSKAGSSAAHTPSFKVS